MQRKTMMNDSSMLTGIFQSDLNLVEEALKECNGVKTCAARKLGTTESRVRRILKKAHDAYDVEFKEHRYQEQIRALKKEIERLQERRFQDQAFEAFVRQALKTPAAPPEWVVQNGSTGSENIAMQVLSEIHYPEVVTPQEVMHLNAYDPVIADDRIMQFFVGAVRISKEILSGLNIKGAVQFWVGDMLSGDIHEELVDTNAFPSLPALLSLRDMLVTGVRYTADEMGRVHIAAVPGNHPRRTKRPRAKQYAVNNLDWLLYHLVAQEFRSDPRVTFSIGFSTDLQLKVLGWTYHITHGDQARGGSGISGALAPLMLLDHRKRKWSAQTGTSYDYLVVGHWHQLFQVAGIIVNGSVVGYNEYALQKNFAYQSPQQAYWVTHPQRGLTYFTPIFLEGKNEGWRDNPDWKPSTDLLVRAVTDTPKWVEE